MAKYNNTVPLIFVFVVKQWQVSLITVIKWSLWKAPWSLVWKN